jgi:probable phosphoglycerate mutase
VLANVTTKLPFDRTHRRRIHLMRHAEAAYFEPDGKRASDSRLVTLTERGRAEAAAMAQLLAAVEFDRAICSGLARTLETAKIVMGDRKETIDVIPALEEIRGGDAVARAAISPPDLAYAMFRAGLPNACFAGGEPFARFAARVIGAFQQIVAAQDWTSLLMVCHGGVNRAILTEVTGAGLKAFGAFEQDSCCLNVIDVDCCLEGGEVERWILRAVNATADDPIKSTRRLLTLEGVAMRLAGEMGSPTN